MAKSKKTLEERMRDMEQREQESIEKAKRYEGPYLVRIAAIFRNTEVRTDL